ncbi:unnamed protein product [Ambrosiozyma monospora]|uniref:Unnamed protein product n=1 Tax=Ambrosiozyma monospora TaxID=43982 RepID=A0ACB5T554_AMBMO|nr:unnamed protein product [Ambrosiozyma monospora]
MCAVCLREGGSIKQRYQGRNRRRHVWRATVEVEWFGVGETRGIFSSKCQMNIIITSHMSVSSLQQLQLQLTATSQNASFTINSSRRSSVVELEFQVLTAIMHAKAVRQRK